jgi:arylsulfatase A-like enzyme
MGLAHGGMRQKNFNMYEESLNVPLVYSNPVLYPKPLATDALVSHVDFVPTLASILQAPRSARANWEGKDYSSIVMNPVTAKPVQDYVVFQ